MSEIIFFKSASIHKCLHFQFTFSLDTIHSDHKMFVTVIRGFTIMVSTTSALATAIFSGSAVSTDLARRARINVGYLTYLLAANEPAFEQPRQIIGSVVPRIVRPRPIDPDASPIQFVEIEQLAQSTSPSFALSEAVEPLPNPAPDTGIVEGGLLRANLAFALCPSNNSETDLTSRVDAIIETIRNISSDLSRSVPFPMAR